MVTPNKKNSAVSFIRTIILTIVGSAALSGVLGYTIAMQTSSDQLSVSQVEFVDGVAAGVLYKKDLEDWQEEKSTNPADQRANPQVRCASEFFPDFPLAMQGCLLALNGRPEGGYQPKMPR